MWYWVDANIFGTWQDIVVSPTLVLSRAGPTFIKQVKTEILNLIGLVFYLILRAVSLLGRWQVVWWKETVQSNCFLMPITNKKGRNVTFLYQKSGCYA